MANIDDLLLELDSTLRDRGYEMDQVTLEEVARRMMNPVVMKAIDAGQLTIAKLADEAVKGIETVQQRQQAKTTSPLIGATSPQDVSFAAEGGPINDRSGQMTQQLRRQQWRLN